MLPDVPLDGDSIRGHLIEVAEVLGSTGDAQVIIIVGGALLALQNLRDATTDADSVTRLNTELQQAVAVVGARHSLARRWLNDAALPFLPANFDQSLCTVVLSHLRLVVLGTPLEQIFPMKLYGARTRDIEDLVTIWHHAGLTRQNKSPNSFAKPIHTLLRISFSPSLFQKFPQKHGGQISPLSTPLRRIRGVREIGRHCPVIAIGMEVGGIRYTCQDRRDPVRSFSNQLQKLSFAFIRSVVVGARTRPRKEPIASSVWTASCIKVLQPKFHPRIRIPNHGCPRQWFLGSQTPSRSTLSWRPLLCLLCRTP
jgi:Nucleotidyltransferase of unknown function (DUF6036)